MLVLFTIRRKCASNSEDERKPNSEGRRAGVPPLRAPCGLVSCFSNKTGSVSF